MKIGILEILFHFVCFLIGFKHFITVLTFKLADEESSTRFAPWHRTHYAYLQHFVYARFHGDRWLGAILCLGSGHPYFLCIFYLWCAVGHVRIRSTEGNLSEYFLFHLFFIFNISFKSYHFYPQVRDYGWGCDCSFCQLIGINSSSGTFYKTIFSVVDIKVIVVPFLWF